MIEYLMYQVKLCSMALQWVYSDMHFPSSRMDELIHTTTSVKPHYYRSRIWDLGGGGRSMEMAIADRIFDLSGATLFCSLTMVI